MATPGPRYSAETARLTNAAPDMLKVLEFIEDWIKDGADIVHLSALFGDEETLADAVTRVTKKARS
jgi:hypothetical protein